MTEELPATAQLRALVIFTRRFATMVDSGMSLMRCFATLRQDSPEPYAAAAGALMASIEDGGTLTSAMSAQPALFPPIYRAMMRAGEVGGVVDITLNRTADWLESGYRLVSRHGETQGLTMLYLPNAGALPDDLQALSTTQRLALLAIFCTAWGMLLNSGVPILHSIETVADLLPTTQKAQALAAIDGAHRRERVTPYFSFLPPLVTTLIALGEETGQLDTVLLRLGKNYQRELELAW